MDFTAKVFLIFEWCNRTPFSGTSVTWYRDLNIYGVRQYKKNHLLFHIFKVDLILRIMGTCFGCACLCMQLANDTLVVCVTLLFQWNFIFD